MYSGINYSKLTGIVVRRGNNSSTPKLWFCCCVVVRGLKVRSRRSECVRLIYHAQSFDGA